MALFALFSSRYCTSQSTCLQVDLWVLLVVWLVSCVVVAFVAVHVAKSHQWLVRPKCCGGGGTQVRPQDAAMLALKRDASEARITSHKNKPDHATQFFRQTQRFNLTDAATSSGANTTSPAANGNGNANTDPLNVSANAIPTVKARRGSNVVMDAAATTNASLAAATKPRNTSVFLRRQLTMGKRILLLGGSVRKLLGVGGPQQQGLLQKKSYKNSKVGGAVTEMDSHFEGPSYQQKEALAVLPVSSRSAQESKLSRELTSKRRVSVGTDAELTFYVGAAEQEQQASVYEIKLKEIQLVRRLACSSTSEIYAASWRDTKVCVKLLLPKEGMVQNLEQSVKNFRREIWIMSVLKHPNVVQLIGASLTANCYVLVMEYMTNGSLYEYLRDENNFLPTEMMMTCAYDVAAGMKYIHQCKVLQRDIKSRNLLLSDNLVVKVCDFGLSRFQDLRYGPYTFVGTPFWAAPEIIRHEPYSEKADVYSYGIVLWELAERKDPYENFNAFQVPLLVANEELRPAELSHPAPPGYEALMHRCWHADPAQRPSFVEIYDFFDHWHQPMDEPKSMDIKDLGTHVLTRHLQTNVTERDHFASVHDLHEKSIPIVLSSKLQKHSSLNMLIKQDSGLSADTL